MHQLIFIYNCKSFLERGAKVDVTREAYEA